MTTATAPGRVSAPAGTTDIFVPKGMDFARILANVLPSASKDDTLPVLCGVRVTVTADRITVAATDRYTISEDYITRGKDDEAWPDAAFTLARSDVDRIVKLCKADKLSPLTLSLDGGRVTASGWDLSVGCATVDGEFPRTERLYPADDWGPRHGWTEAGFNPQYFGRFAKICSGTNGTKPELTVRLDFYGDGNVTRKPVLVTVPGYESFRGLIMPIRLADGA